MKLITTADIDKALYNKWLKLGYRHHQIMEKFVCRKKHDEFLSNIRKDWWVDHYGLTFTWLMVCVVCACLAFVFLLILGFVIYSKIT